MHDSVLFHLILLQTSLVVQCRLPHTLFSEPPYARHPSSLSLPPVLHTKVRYWHCITPVKHSTSPNLTRQFSHKIHKHLRAFANQISQPHRHCWLIQTSEICFNDPNRTHNFLYLCQGLSSISIEAFLGTPTRSESIQHLLVRVSALLVTGHQLDHRAYLPTTPELSGKSIYLEEKGLYLSVPQHSPPTFFLFFFKVKSQGQVQKYNLILNNFSRIYHQILAAKHAIILKKNSTKEGTREETQ